MTELWEITKLIRSKNAGPWELTFDIMFNDQEALERCRTSELTSVAFFSQAYGVEEAQVEIFIYEEALAIKVTVPRPQSAGAVGDTDVFGGQFHGPLVKFVVPEAV